MIFSRTCIPLVFSILVQNIYPVILTFAWILYEAPVSGQHLNIDPVNHKSDTISEKTCVPAVPTCPKSRYRAIDGTCNNKENPTLATPNTPYGHVVENSYADGIYAMPKSLSGGPLPNPRHISLVISTGKKDLALQWNLNAMQWGQIITHDMSSLMTPTDIYREIPQCCDSIGHLAADANTSALCIPVLISANDVFYKKFNVQCLDLQRGITTKDIGCTSANSPAYQLNLVTGFMDLSTVYGHNEKQAASLRTGRGGRLKTVKRHGHEWPPQVSNVKKICLYSKSSDEPCYKTGDVRSSQNLHLVILQVMLLREHNRIAETLSNLNPHWNDEIIFQEARRIFIAIYQQINYYEYLPILLGWKNMLKNKLIYPDAKGYINDYNPNINPSVLKEHATAAFRYFHTMIRGKLKLISEERKTVGYLSLNRWYFRPAIIEDDDNFDDLTRGLSFQQEDESNQYYNPDITNCLFSGNNSFGSDLRATDIQRGRDQGLGRYVAVRAYCNLSVPETFEDLLEDISLQNVNMLKSLYSEVNDIELVVGGSLENHLPGALAGPTYVCILLQQFYRTRVGDRFFFENGDEDIAFAPSQLETIRRGSSIARLFCDNGNNIKYMQPRAYELLSNKNKLIACEELPSVDLTLWQDTTE